LLDPNPTPLRQKKHPRNRKNAQIQQFPKPSSPDLQDFEIDGRKMDSHERNYLDSFLRMRAQLTVDAAQKLGTSAATLDSMALGIHGTRAANPWDGFQIQFSKTNSKPGEMCEEVTLLSMSLF
jgi:hypothetical protein